MSLVKILDMDIETRKVGFHIGGRFNPDGCEPVCIAWSWGKDIICLSLTTEWSPPLSMLAQFRRAWDKADLVTGHYIRKFDLPILNAAMMEWGLPPLGEKLISDTKEDLLKRAGLGASQENLGVLYNLEQSKFHMSDQHWREVARLTVKGLKLARERVVSDVRQHMALRGALLRAGMLKVPRVWAP
jgi:hypothetical protein